MTDGRIAAIGDLAGATADKTLGAAGRIVLPGFIDSHTPGRPASRCGPYPFKAKLLQIATSTDRAMSQEVA